MPGISSCTRRSLERLLADGFERLPAAPVGKTTVPKGGEITVTDAYRGKLRDGREVILLRGSWYRGTVLIKGASTPIYNLVGGLYSRSSSSTPICRLTLSRHIRV
jgi:hypothetical protein